MQKWWWPPWMASQDRRIHSFKECVPEGSDYISTRRRSLIHKKRRGDGRNWRSSSHHPKKIPQAMRNMKNSTLEEPLIHLSIWIRNNVIMNEEDDEGSRTSQPMKQINISIQLLFHDIILLCICLYSVDVLCMIEFLH